MAPSPEHPRLSRRLSRDAIIVWLITLLGLIPIFAVQHMPSQDGPAHIYIAQMLRLFNDPFTPLISRYFELNSGVHPNLFIYMAAQPLLSILSPAMAEKILAAAYVLLIPVATLSLATAARRSITLTYLALWPMLFGFMFFFGFYNYCFALLLAIIGVACWLWMRRTQGAAPVAALCATSFAAYFVHLFPLANMMLFIGAGALIDTWRMVARKTDHESRLAALKLNFVRMLARPALALTPALIMVLIFIANRAGSETSYHTDKGAYSYGLTERFTHLSMLSFNISYGPWDALLSIAMMVIGVTAFMMRDRNQSLPTPAATPPPFAALVIIFLIVYWTIPGTISGHTFVLDRILPVLYLSFVLWLIHVNLTKRQIKVLVGGLTVLGIALPLFRAYQTVALDHFMRPFYAVSKHLAPNRTLLAVRGAYHRSNAALWRPYYRVNVPVHASTALAAKVGLIDLKVVQANSSVVPLKYRGGVNPYRYLPASLATYPAVEPIRIYENFRLETALPPLDIEGYRERTGGEVDYLLVWGPSAGYETSLQGRIFRESIDKFFDPIPLDEGSERVRLFRRKGLNVSTAP